MKKLVIYLPLTGWNSISSRFFKSFLDMTGPDIQEQMKKDYDIEMVNMVHSAWPVDYNRNSAIDKAVHQLKSDYLLFLDLDQVFMKDTIPRLMAHISDETPCATGIYFRKHGDNRCVFGFYDPMSEALELKRKSMEAQGFMSEDGKNQYLHYHALRTFDVVQPIDCGGLGILLARTDVFSKIEQPYCKYFDEWGTGDHTFQNISEEMLMWAKFKKAGIKVMCDPAVRAGHIREVVVGCNMD